ncbi:2-amino-5-chloromuconate deaminase [Rhodovastum atsumiense]|uniref:RidA family protein n=1 Tax=Rhodovastum atsumiense TaxID=504468 RepID=A0A5M6J3D7_9PROT|nr:hypothetical protein [Rhodovastum atsumiense]KAA5614175.1 hypothetical protein F1189_02995 [Rhodovastum atsumiense]CAH2599031.1 2-amino-5-chloromuconate deaminase [Rhodovastum atsumiense]
MGNVIDFAAGGYRFVPGVTQYSGGVAALPGFAIIRMRFEDPVPLADGFERIATHLRANGRPSTALCACELRSPEPFSEPEFEEFNRRYCGTLDRWGLLQGGATPVARVNVCPELDRPPVPSFHAFSYTVRDAAAAPSFVIAGCAEAPEGRGSYREHIIARGDVSPGGMLDKADWVLGELERRMAVLGFGWADTTAVQVYTVHDIFPFFGPEIARRGAARHGVTWQFCRPPVVELEFEMDCRGVAQERVL